MSASVVQGKNVVIQAFNIDGYYGFYCAQTVEINFTTDQIPATGMNSGSIKQFRPGKTGWTVTLSGLTFVKDTSDGTFNVFDMTDEQARQNGFDIQMIFTNILGNTETFSGHINPASTTVGGTVGQISKFTTQFQGTGPWQRNANIPQTANNELMVYYYTATGTEPDFFTVPSLINKNIKAVFRASPLGLLFNTGTPNPQQVLITTSTGKFQFGSNLNAGELILIEYT